MSTHTVNGSISSQSECETAGLMWTESTSGGNHTDDEGEHEAGYVVVHIEEEGDYGFAVPLDVEFYILAEETGPFEWAGVFEIADSSHTWTMQKVDGAYADPSMRLVLIPTDAATEEAMEAAEEGVGEMIEGDSCTVIEAVSYTHLRAPRDRG